MNWGVKTSSAPLKHRVNALPTNKPIRMDCRADLFGRKGRVQQLADPGIFYRSFWYLGGAVRTNGGTNIGVFHRYERLRHFRISVGSEIDLN